jgi:hypothetical protein
MSSLIYIYTSGHHSYISWKLPTLGPAYCAVQYPLQGEVFESSKGLYSIRYIRSILYMYCKLPAPECTKNFCYLC